MGGDIGGSAGGAEALFDGASGSGDAEVHGVESGWYVYVFFFLKCFGDICLFVGIAI